MPAQVTWHGDKLRAQIEREMNRRVKACCILVLNHAKLLISIEGAAKVSKGYKTATRTVRKGTLIYGANPSKPGQPPHKQTGRLMGSIAFEVIGMVGRVGTNVKYGRFLELGTRLMAARPWLRRALREMEPQIMAILRAPMKFAA